MPRAAGPGCHLKTVARYGLSTHLEFFQNTGGSLWRINTKGQQNDVKQHNRACGYCCHGRQYRRDAHRYRAVR
jgi:hypothetical protein